MMIRTSRLRQKTWCQSRHRPIAIARYYTREFPYRLVWESPVLEVAKRLGESDVGLAKACRRARIPVPTRGYWAKLAAGKWVGPPPDHAAPAPILRLMIRSR